MHITIKKLFFIFVPFIYLLILLFVQEKAFTQDLGRHLKTGEIIARTLSVPQVNLFSYVEPNFPFINHHWLSEIIFYGSSIFFGLNSIIFIKILAIFISFGIVFYLSFKRAGLFWTFLFSIPYLSLFSYRFDARPEVFSFIFMALFLFLIEKFRQTKKLQYLLPLPAIELLWVNMHIYFIIGIIIVGIFMAAEFLHWKKNINKTVLLIFLATCAVTFLNPSGLTGALQPFFILQHYGYSIVENQNIFFLNSILPTSAIILFEILAVVGGILLFCSQKKDWYVVLLFVVSAILGADMVRNFPIFVLATFPYVPQIAGEIEKRFDPQVQKIVKGTMLSLVCIFLLTDSAAHVQSPIRGFSYYVGAQDSINFFQTNHLKGPIFNNFDIGSYLIYRLYPSEKVYVDGRPEAYSVAFFDEYKKMQTDPAEFARQDAKYHFNTIVFSHTDLTPWAQTFLASVLKNPNWVPVYLDPMMVIFVKNVDENNSIIEKYRLKI